MSRIQVIHKECGGPLTDDDNIHPEHPLLSDLLAQEDFSMVCLTCLQEVTDPSELTLVESLPQ